LGTRLTADVSAVDSLLVPSDAAPVLDLTGPWVLQAVITAKKAHNTNLLIALFALTPNAHDWNTTVVFWLVILYGAVI
jgi:hypothetical protein